MKFEIEQQDLEAIALRVSEILKPMIASLVNHWEKDIIFDVKGLAKYLQVDCGWVYKQISLKTIPVFKCGKYDRFRKKDIDRWIENHVVRPVSPLKLVRNRGVAS